MRFHGDYAPLVVELYVTAHGVAVHILGGRFQGAGPHRLDRAMPKPGVGGTWATCSRWGGRARSAIGKQVRCRLPAEPGAD